MVRRHTAEEEVEEEEGEETKAEENLSQVMSKNKKDQENHLINQNFDVITIKNFVDERNNEKKLRVCE